MHHHFNFTDSLKDERENWLKCRHFDARQGMYWKQTVILLGAVTLLATLI